jgi:glycosyltransferase involved in cell wall biosynthesis
VTVSAIIPTHDHGRFLAQSIGSARVQRPAPDEIVVVDDGSTDETQEVLAGLAGPDLVVLRQPRGGPASARNRAIEASRGEWLAFLDADTYWLPGKLEAMLRTVAAAPEPVALAYSGYLVVDDDGRPVASRPAPHQPYAARHLLWGNRFATSTTMARRSAVLAAGSFDERLSAIGEDWDLWLRLMSRHPVAHVTGPLVACRRSRFDDKYRLDDLEIAIEEVLRRHRAPRRALGWHRALLAKGYARRGRPWPAARCLVRALASHPTAMLYLVPNGLTRAVPPELDP